MPIKKLIKLSLFLLLLTSFISSTAALSGDFPFTDVKESDELYKDLSLLYKNNVIKETADGRFHPESLMTRNEFLGIVIGVGCKSCINPTIEDFLKYDTSPFVDLSKLTPYYYCIAEGKANGITQGYILNEKGEYTCQNNKTYNSTPFCPENNTTRIEAVAMLLRIAKVWDDDLNSKVEKTMQISDIDDAWYGFAKKGIEIGILKKDKGNKVFPNEYINKREFIHMATKIFGINFCDANQDENDAGLSSDIKIYDKNNKNSCSGKGTETSFSDPKATSYDFYAYTESRGDLEYIWEFTNTTTDKVIQATGPCLDDYILGDGNWIVKLTIKDKKTGASTVSYSQIGIDKSGSDKNSGISTDISADPIYGEGPLNINFESEVTGNKGNVTYVWDFGDGTTSNEADPNHTYSEPGFYTVNLKVIDADGNTGVSQLTVEVAETIDTDKDGIRDSIDKCPMIIGILSNSGCPSVNEYNPIGDKGATGTNDDISVQVKIFDKDNRNSCDGAGTLSDFSDKKETVYDFYGYTESKGNFEYIWEFTNTTTNETIKKTGRCVDDFDFKSNGIWIAKLTIRDKDTGKVSTSTSQLSITDDPTSSTATGAADKISVSIDANPIAGSSPLPIELRSLVDGADGDVTYKWIFGDGQTSNEQNPTHTYTLGGTYTLALEVTDSKGNKGRSQIVVVVKGDGSLVNKDDGINNLCLSQKAKGKGTIDGLLQCNSCPCSYSIDYISTLVACDIVFPAITSIDKKNIYSRGAVYQIK